MRLFEAGCEEERAAAALGALDPEPSAHQLDESQRDREPQPRAAVAPRRRAVRLRERLEDLSLLLRSYADAGVADREVERHAVRAHRLHAHAENDFTRRRELDGVPHHIQQDLPETAGISKQDLRNVGDDVTRELDAFFGGAERQQLGGVADRLAQIEFGVLEVEPLRFDLREVQDVVDDFEQRLGR